MSAGNPTEDTAWILLIRESDFQQVTDWDGSAKLMLMNESLLSCIRTPHKLGRLVLEPSFRKGDFDSHAVDCPFLFRHDGCYWMTRVGWDGAGYQTGLARSDDLLNWEKQGILIGRGPKGSVTEHNVAMTGILRDNIRGSTAVDSNRFEGFGLKKKSPGGAIAPPRLANSRLSAYLGVFATSPDGNAIRGLAYVPAAAADASSIVSIDVDSNDMINVTFSSVSGQVYDVQLESDLVDGTWTNDPSNENISGTGTSIIVNVNSDPDTQNIRVATESD